jgi:hypothetical protein
MNESKARSARVWEKWRRAGALGNIETARRRIKESILSLAELLPPHQDQRLGAGAQYSRNVTIPTQEIRDWKERPFLEKKDIGDEARISYFVITDPVVAGRNENKSAIVKEVYLSVDSKVKGHSLVAALQVLGNGDWRLEAYDSVDKNVVREPVRGDLIMFNRLLSLASQKGQQVPLPNGN